jgi:MoaA/NifB/PqqE/SkfB family radical SAM enzyme
MLSHSQRFLHTLLSAPDRLAPLARLWARPLRIHLAINDVCNIRCPHCLRYAPSVKVNRGSLALGDLRRLAPWFRSAHTVALAGLGEPFLQKDLFDIIKFIESHGPTISVITNATLLDEAAAQRLVGTRLLLLNLSIDAGTREVFEKVRLGAKFDEVTANLDRLVEMKRQRNTPFPVLAINMTLMKDTLGEVEAVIALAKRWEVPLITAQTVMFAPDAPDRSQSVTNQEAQAALARAADHARAAGVEIRYVPLSSDFATLSLDEVRGDLYAPSYAAHKHSKSSGGANRFFCPNIWSQMWVDTTGEMMYCCMANQEFQDKFGPIGKIQDNDPATLWNHPKLVALRRSHVQGCPPEECRKCYALERHGRGKTWSALCADFASLKRML